MSSEEMQRQIEALREKMRYTGVLMHQWGQAEHLCSDLCHKLEWTSDGDTIRRLEEMLARARKRAIRRHERYRNWYMDEVRP